jgi:putative Holliday junction resolvase
MRYLGVDSGTKRIGIALSDTRGIVSPLKVLQSTGNMQQDARQILSLADEYAVDTIILGLPLNMDGTEGPQAQFSRQLAETIEAQGETPVQLFDERLTSRAADSQLVDGRRLTRKKKKARHDAVAAQVLLQSYLEDKGPEEK